MATDTTYNQPRSQCNLATRLSNSHAAMPSTCPRTVILSLAKAQNASLHRLRRVFYRGPRWHQLQGVEGEDRRRDVVLHGAPTTRGEGEVTGVPSARSSQANAGRNCGDIQKKASVGLDHFGSRPVCFPVNPHQNHSKSCSSMRCLICLHQSFATQLCNPQTDSREQSTKPLKFCPSNIPSHSAP